MATKETIQLGVREGGKWTGEWAAPQPVHTTATLQSLRQSSRYYVISDTQLKRDLQGRTLADVYRENRARRGVEYKYVPRWVADSGRQAGGGLFDGMWLPGKAQSPETEYLAWCKARNHTPHPASLDASHPQNAHRLKAPKREACEGHIVRHMDENERAAA